MFRIRRVFDDVLPVNKSAIAEVRQIFREQFSAAPADDIDLLGERLRNPFMQRFRSILYVADKGSTKVVGFALILHDPELKFFYLDYLAAGKMVTGRGVGAALYEFIRDEAILAGMQGLFFECLPDTAEACRDPQTRKQNASRLKFYENYGVRPIINTAYETPVPGGSDDNLPYLMFDDLGQPKPLQAKYLQQVAQAILERKYGYLCPPEYVQQVVQSVHDPVVLRDFRYVKQKPLGKPAISHRRELIVLTVNDKHDIHHIRERGYVEAPVRIAAIKTELDASGLFETVPVREFGLPPVLEVHAQELVDYLQRACANSPAGKSVYPYVFPIRNATRPPKELSVLSGYFCIDTFTPINQNAYPAARRAVDASLTAADAILAGRRLAYALVRPPGHHAERRSFGGFCYFCNAGIAAQYLSKVGRVAILDIDYHHGNGQQDIFYHRSDVFTVSLHGDPDFAYPYFTGFADEIGVGIGEGFNLNLPLPESQTGEQYRQTLKQALSAIRRYDPAFLVVALGLDPAKGDPTGTWQLGPKDFELNGIMIGELDLPTLVIQEGGYRTRTLGTNARHFFQGLFRSHDD